MGTSKCLGTRLIIQSQRLASSCQAALISSCIFTIHWLDSSFSSLRYRNSQVHRINSGKNNWMNGWQQHKNGSRYRMLVLSPDTRSFPQESVWYTRRSPAHGNEQMSGDETNNTIQSQRLASSCQAALISSRISTLHWLDSSFSSLCYRNSQVHRINSEKRTIERMDGSSTRMAADIDC